jgi:hypothetical protein
MAIQTANIKTEKGKTKMRYLKRPMRLLLVLCIAVCGSAAAFGQQPYRRTYYQTRQLVRRIDNRSQTFKNSFARALDRSAVKGSSLEDQMNSAAANLEQSARDLSNNFDNRSSTQAEVQELLQRALPIDSFMRNHRLAYAAENNWRMLRADLDQLASNYYVAWRWDNAMPLPYPLPYRMTQAQMGSLISRIETETDRFSNDIPGALDRSRLNGSDREDDINKMVTDFEYATDQLKQRFNQNMSTSSDVQNVMQRAARIDGVMTRNHFNNRTESDWVVLKNDLNQLASTYSVAWNWNSYPLPSQISDWQLTGTYQLNLGMSDDPRTVADQAVRNGNFGTDQNTIYVHLVERLDPPQMLAIDKTGNEIRLASSRSPEVTLDANGREYLEPYPGGRTSHVRATLTGNKLTVVSNGNQPNDFTATFEPLDNGQRMLVTREMYAERLNHSVRVRSYYNRTSAVAQFNIFTGPAWGDQGRVQARGNFIVPNGTMMVASLNQFLTTKTATDGDTFTMTVQEPASYRNATIEGHLTNVDRSGRFAGRANMTFNFDRIRLRNGQTFPFAGIVENLQASNGEDIRVDNEGAVAEQDSQSKDTLERSAIGGAVGALIGAIAGGGKGAAIGAAVGAGAGAGSVYVQGRDDLDLSRDSRVTIRASAPRY